MNVVIIIFCIVSAIIMWVKSKEWFNPGTVFLAHWSLIVFLASLRLYNLNETSYEAYKMIFLGVFAYFLGAFICGNKSIKIQWSTTERIDDGSYEINYLFLIVSEIVIILYSLYRIYIIVKLLANGNTWWAIRLMATSGESGAGTLKGGYFSSLMYEIIVAPLAYLVAPTIVVDFISGNRKKKTLILGVLSMVMFSIATVSRAIWAFTIIYVVFTGFMYRDSFELTPKQKKGMKYIPVVIILIFLIIVKITNMRASGVKESTDLLCNAYVYLCGALPLLSSHLEASISIIRTKGMFSFFGFLYPVLFVLNRLHIMTYPASYFDVLYIKEYLEVFRNIGENLYMNAYTTMFFNFFIDFGFVGVFLGSFLFAYLCMKSFIAFQKYKTIKDAVLYLVLLQFIIFSMARIYTIYSTRALTLVWIIPMFVKKKNLHIMKKNILGSGGCVEKRKS